MTFLRAGSGRAKHINQKTAIPNDDALFTKSQTDSHAGRWAFTNDWEILIAAVVPNPNATLDEERRQERASGRSKKKNSRKRPHCTKHKLLSTLRAAAAHFTAAEPAVANAVILATRSRKSAAQRNSIL